MYGDLLVHVDGEPARRSTVQFAVGLAERLGAHLLGLHVTPPADVPPLYKPSHVTDAVAQATDALASEVRAAAEMFDDETQHLCGLSRWRQSRGDIIAGICSNARYADLVILGQYEHQSSPERSPLPIAHSVALQCGRPVVVVPPDFSSATLSRVAIAWDGSREAVRAVHDALPLLCQAESVQIVTALAPDTKQDEYEAKRLSEHLCRHGVMLESDVFQIRSTPEHESLRQQIAQGSYDLLVMRGYSHPMWLEFVFGSATQSVLLSTKIPVLVSH